MALVSPSGNPLTRTGFLGSKSLSTSGRPLLVRCTARAGRVGLVEKKPNFYEVLGLSSQDVDLSSIKTAYRQMAMKYHPDVCPREELEECTRRFIVLQEAYETLSDSRRRAMYDLALSGALDSHAIAVSWFDSETEGFKDWKMRWADQLSGLKRRSVMKEHENPDSWASRMRRKHHDQQVV